MSVTNLAKYKKKRKQYEVDEDASTRAYDANASIQSAVFWANLPQLLRDPELYAGLAIGFIAGITAFEFAWVMFNLKYMFP